MLKAYTDGACRGGNPGFASCAWVLYNGDKEVASNAEYLGPDLRTNNYAEYSGLYRLLLHLYREDIEGVVIHCDSKLVVNQVNHSWAIRKEDLRLLSTYCYGMLTRGGHRLEHIKGHSGNTGNDRADQLCNAVLDAHKEEYESYATQPA
jgi:ribonuclease HI